MSLKVLESYNEDVGKGVARVNYRSLDLLGASTDTDVVEIKAGEHRTVARCLRLNTSDEERRIIRFDDL